MITIEQIASVPLSGSDFDETERLKAHFANLRGSRDPFYLDSDDFEEVLQWKLRSQYGRIKKHFSRIRSGVLVPVTRAAFEIKDSDARYEAEFRVRVLSSLPGVGVPVASAMLTLVEPEKFGVLDFRVWRQVFPQREEGFTSTVKQYLEYMDEIWRLSGLLGWPPQKVDWCIWEYDRLHDEDEAYGST